MSITDNIERKINYESKGNIFNSVIAETNSIVIQLQQFGYDKIYSRRVFYYLHPQDLEEALNYMAIENGIIQHVFIPDRINSKNLCYICGDIREKHIKILNINNNIYNQIKNEEEFEKEQKKENNIKIKNNNRKSSKKFSIFIESNIEQINTEKNLNTKDELSLKKEEKIECEICNDLFIASEKNTVLNCGHSFCCSCWYDSLSVKIKENKLSSIKCLDYYCKEKLTDAFIIYILNTDNDLIERYKRYKLELEIMNDPNKKLCPYPNCDSYLELIEIKKKDVTCKNNHAFCFECLDKPHGNLPCNTKLYNSIIEFAKNHFVKKCPKCGIIIEKNEGCNHIICIQCGYQWCWLCNQKYNSDHFYTGKCKGFQFFQPNNEYEIKLLMEGKIKYNDLSTNTRRRFREFDDDFVNEPRNNQIQQDCGELILFIIFYIFFGNLCIIFVYFTFEINENKLNIMIYFMFLIAFFFQMMFLNIITMIFIPVFTEINVFMSNEFKFFVERLFLIIAHLFSSIFLIVFYRWKKLINHSHIPLKDFIRTIIAFPCFFTSIIILLPQRIIINIIIIIFNYFKSDNSSDFMSKLDTIFEDAINYRLLNNF